MNPKPLHNYSDNEIVLPHPHYDHSRDVCIILRKNPDWEDIIDTFDNQYYIWSTDWTAFMYT